MGSQSEQDARKQLYNQAPLTSRSGQIRLLRIKPWIDEDSDIECTFETHSDEPVPEYAAISYTWGEPHLVRSVIVNDIRLHVRHNCWYALWQVRRLRGQGLIWIDSICINQDDLLEKSSQVAMMGDIYSGAAEVCACIGPHGEGSELAIEHAAVLVESRPEGWHGSTSFPWGDEKLYVQFREALLHDMDIAERNRLTDALLALANRSYWSRAWIAQEISLATKWTVLIGTDTLVSPIFVSLYFGVRDRALLDDTVTPYSENAFSRTRLGSVWTFTLGPSTVSHVAEHNLCCGDPRDHVYAVLTLIDWPPLCGSLEPDYTKTKFQLARDALRYFEAETDHSSDNYHDGTLFDFAENLLKGLQISGDDQEFQLFLQLRSGGDRREGIDLFANELNAAACWAMTRSRYEHQEYVPGVKKAVREWDGGHRPMLISGNTQYADVVVAVSNTSKSLLVLRRFADFLEIIGSGVLGPTCHGGRRCNCYDGAVFILNIFAQQIELVVDERDLWAFVTRDWAGIKKANKRSGWAKRLAQNLGPFCTSRFSSMAIYRPTASESLISGESPFPSWAKPY